MAKRIDRMIKQGDAGTMPVWGAWADESAIVPPMDRPDYPGLFTGVPSLANGISQWHYVVGDNGERVYTRPFMDMGGLHNSGHGYPDADDIDPRTGEAYRRKRTSIRDNHAVAHSIRGKMDRNRGKGSKGVPGEYVIKGKGERFASYRIPSNPNGSGLIVEGINPLAEIRSVDESSLYRLAFGFGRKLVTSRLAHESAGFQAYATSIATGDIYQSILCMIHANYDPTTGVDTPNKDGTTSPLYIATAKGSNKPDTWIGKPIVEACRFYAYHAMREYGRTYTPRMPGLFIVRRKDPIYQTVALPKPTVRTTRIVTIGTNYATAKPTRLIVNRDTESVWSVTTDRAFTFARTIPYECPPLTNRKDWKPRTPINAPMGLYRTTDPARTVDIDNGKRNPVDCLIDTSTDPARIVENRERLTSVGKRMADVFATLPESDLILIRKAMRGERVTQAYPKGADKDTKKAINNANDRLHKRITTLIAKLSKEVA